MENLRVLNRGNPSTARKLRPCTGALLVVSALCAATAASQPPPAALRAYLTATTDYIDRGLSQSASHGSAQFGIDYQHRSGFFVGAWATDVEYARRRSEEHWRTFGVDYYAGYARRNGDWSWSTALARYAYPGAPYDYDYTELNGSVSYRERLSYSVALIPNLLSVEHRALDQAVSLRFPARWNVELSATAGKFRAAGLPSANYSYWNAGASKVLPRFVIDLRYYDTNAASLGPLGARPRRRWVLSLSHGFDLIAPRSARSEVPAERPSRPPQGAPAPSTH